GFFSIGDDVIHGGSSLFYISVHVGLVGAAKLEFGNSHTDSCTLRGGGILHAGFQFIDALVPGRGNGSESEKHPDDKNPHGVQWLFGSMATRRWRAWNS